ncbi:hypothetical protein ACFL0M_09000 [Thermodesulfobacteriota bacterium]
MTDNIIKGKITNMESGDVFFGDHYLFYPGSDMTTIIKILKTESYVHPDDSMQVSVDCLGLNSVGGVFELGLEYAPDTIEKRDQLLQDLMVGSVFMVKGEYGTADNFITIFDEDYRPVEPDFSEEDVREAFRINGKEWENKFTIIK